MQGSGWSIIPALIAALLGGFICFVLTLSHGVLVAVAVSPFAGSATAVGAIALLWTARHFISRKQQAGEAVQVHAAE